MERTLTSAFDTARGDIAAGRCVLVHGDSGGFRRAVLMAAADRCGPEMVNRMARDARGLVCVSIDRALSDRLGLRLQPRRNAANTATGFTVSVEAAKGVTTGISAEDRACTIAALIDPGSTSGDINTPGHVFPVVAAEGGVLANPMLPEATLDLARMAGCGPNAVFCDVLDDEGELAGLEHVAALSASSGIACLDIRDLIRERRKTERIVEQVHSTRVETQEGGGFRLYLYRNRLSTAEHIVLVKGDPETRDVLPVRVHSLNITDDILRWQNFGQPDHVGRYLRAVKRAGAGVLILIRETFSTTLADRFKTREAQASTGYGGSELVDFGIPAQILSDLGVTRFELLSESPGDFGDLTGFGLNCVGTRAVRDEG
ncbi:MAG: 3,4-dihydroxy-2-butanone-4-phosphate synthase [Pseudomonadota bacterium]|nr:3,4-dihydroxy-2-butanone-4-phosphate synthase [Pseudomonadota bacterium]